MSISKGNSFTILQKKLFQIMGLEIKDIRKYEQSLNFNNINKQGEQDLDENGIIDDDEKKFIDMNEIHTNILERAIRKFEIENKI